VCSSYSPPFSPTAAATAAVAACSIVSYHIFYITLPTKPNQTPRRAAVLESGWGGIPTHLPTYPPSPSTLTKKKKHKEEEEDPGP
jgi:hypothetical protein